MMAVTLRDNGSHEYYETKTFLVLRNHGEKRWTAMKKHDGGGYQILGGRNRRSKCGEIISTSYPAFRTAEEAIAFAKARC